MSSRFLLGLFDSVYVVALTAWVGSILFFSFGVAPIIFGVLGEQTGGKFVRALFPRYYLWARSRRDRVAGVCGAAALLSRVPGADDRRAGDGDPRRHPEHALWRKLADAGDQSRHATPARRDKSGLSSSIAGRSGSMRLCSSWAWGSW